MVRGHTGNVLGGQPSCGFDSRAFRFFLITVMLYKPQEPFPEDGFVASDTPYTGLHVLVLGEYSARQYVPAENEVCISIISRPYRGLLNTSPVPLHPQFVDVLRLRFDDTAVSHRGDEAAQSITPEQSQQVAEFTRKHTDKNKLVIHCFAGMSRSRSMAAAIAESLQLPFKFTVVNPHVFNSVKQAFVRGQLII